jgi:hypothetical protein
LVAWNLVQRPLQLGGLGVPDFKLLVWELRLWWVWLCEMDPSHSWAALPAMEDATEKAFFLASMTCILGDGESTLFWTDP